MTKPTGKPRGRPRKQTTLEVLPPAPPKFFTPASVAAYDFTGWDWRELPKEAVKAARNGAVTGHTITGKLEDGCVNCKRETWTCDAQRENLCEECDYFLRRENRELLIDRAKRNSQKPVNPFTESENRSHGINPFRDLR